MRQSLVITFVLLLCAGACAENSLSEGAERRDVVDDELGKLLAEVESIRAEANVAGAGVALVSRDGTIYVGGFGVQSLESLEPASADTWFRLGSITKSFVGLTALSRLRDQPDLFRIPVNAVIPELLNEKHGGDKARLPDLLEHTAGLSDLSREEFAFQGERVTFKEAVSLDADTRTLRWPVSQHSSYSNAGYGLAGYMLETAAGKPFEALVQQHVLDPAGMKTAGFFVGSDTPVLAAGYNTDGVTPIPYWHMLYRSFGGLNATPKDMASFVKALLQPEGSTSLFRDKSERERFENPSTTLAAETGLTYGYGLGNYHWFSEGLRFHGHGGDADGYLSHYGYSNEAGYGYFIVITAFNKKPLNEMRKAVEHYIATQATTDLEKVSGDASARQTVTLAKSELKKYTGDYVEVTRRFGPLASSDSPSLSISIKNNQLQTRYGGRRQPLVSVSRHHFKRPWQPDATYAFITDERGDVYLQGDMGNFKQLPSGSKP